ncbi:beta-2 adrenergic receptor-like [Stylophora pistillata]|uniref:beta-2 adrenergic receptor-like n=1 Tax=Stylophora pistillata TaxID=50429 RepID=UPI000C0455F1|nr:beta-2 adrenergic receptor-like [Stylophora pistillata]
MPKPEHMTKEIFFPRRKSSKRIVMNELFCDELFQHYPSSLDLEDLRLTYINNCVLNSFLNYHTIIMNALMIHAIRRCSSQPQTWKTFLLSLAVSDVGLGLVVQPFYTLLLVNWLQQNDSGCETIMIFQILGNLFSTASFLGVVALSADRFLAVQLHLRYLVVVTHKRVVAVVISVWVVSGIVSLLTLWNLYETQRLIRITGGVIGLLLTVLMYTKIYFVVRRHKIQIQTLRLQRGEQTCSMLSFDRLFNSVSGTFYVYLAFLVCYLPHIISLAAIKMNGSNISLKELFLYSLSILYLNSSLNPFIYCWKLRHIRCAIMDMLRSLAWKRNRTSN